MVARRFDASATDLLDELAGCGAAPTWQRPVYLCCEEGPDGDARLSVHFPARALDLGPEAMLALARALAARHHGTTAAVDALTGAAARAGGTWTPTVVGVGLAPGGGLGKLNVYLGAGRVEAPGGPRGARAVPFGRPLCSAEYVSVAGRVGGGRWVPWST